MATPVDPGNKPQIDNLPCCCDQRIWNNLVTSSVDYMHYWRETVLREAARQRCTDTQLAAAVEFLRLANAKRHELYSNPSSPQT